MTLNIKSAREVVAGASELTETHHCAESEHHREETDRLRKLLGELEKSNEKLRAESDAEIERWHIVAVILLDANDDQVRRLGAKATREYVLRRDSSRREWMSTAAKARDAASNEVERLRALLLEVCETAADLNELPNDAWRGSTERTSTRNRIEEIEHTARIAAIRTEAGLK
jgi:hypothetical protein